jgi:hypothetical protein
VSSKQGRFLILLDWSLVWWWFADDRDAASHRDSGAYDNRAQAHDWVGQGEASPYLCLWMPLDGFLLDRETPLGVVQDHEFLSKEVRVKRTKINEAEGKVNEAFEQRTVGAELKKEVLFGLESSVLLEARQPAMEIVLQRPLQRPPAAG